MLKLNVEVITPAVAAEYLKSNDGNRKLNKGQVAYYAKMMSEGEWELNGDALKFSPNGRLLDGQHRLQACVEANVPFETVVVREVEEKVFDTFDQGYGRKRGQIFAIANIPNAHSVSASIGRYLLMGRLSVSSLRGIGTGQHGERKIPPRELLECYNKDNQYWQDLLAMAGAMYRRCRLMPASDVVAVIAHLNKRCGYELAYTVEFFEQLFYEERTELGIIRRLRQRLIQDAMSSVKMTSLHKTQLIRKCWDCYKEGRDPQVLKWKKGIEEERPFE